MDICLNDDLITISDLTFSHGDRLLYDRINLTIPRGKVTAVMGPSGIGKTTLLRLIGGQLKPESGHILFDGEDIPTLSRGRLYEVRKRMSMLFQSGALFTGMTVFDNVAFPLREHSGLPEELIHTIVMMKLQAVGLRGAARLMPSELSGGMARRAALARSIALGQDPITMAVLVKLIKELNDALGITSVIVTHDVKEVLSIADYAYIIANRRVVAQGTPEQLREEHNPEVEQFLKGLPDGPVPFHFPAGDLLQDL